MKKALFHSLIFLFLALNVTAFGQKDVYISKEVLKTSEWANFAYKDVLKKAIAGDESSITAFFKFNNAVDGVQGIDHNITCLEMIPLATDDKVASALLPTVPNLKKVVLDRIMLAQGKTKKADLQKPLESWAPKTWAVLNNLPLPAPTVSEQEMAEKLRNKYPDLDADTDPKTTSPTTTPAAGAPRGQKPIGLAPAAGSAPTPIDAGQQQPAAKKQ